MEITKEKLKEIHRFIEDNHEELSKRYLRYSFPIMPYPAKFETGDELDMRKVETLEVVL